MSLLNDVSVLVKSKRLDLTESLPLYKLGLDSAILLEQGMITYNRYVTIVVVSNSKKDFNYTKYFIEEYTERLGRNLQQDALSWAKGHTAYYRGEFMDCLNILLNHDFKEHYFQRISKVLTTQIYFDLYLQDDSYQSYLFNYFDSFEKWIYREKTMSAINNRSFLVFVQKCRAIAKYYADVNIEENKLEGLFKNETNIQAPLWLNKKMAQVILRQSRQIISSNSKVSIQLPITTNRSIH